MASKFPGRPCRYHIIVLPLQSNEPKRGLQNAEIAQLVERNLAKVEVASSSLVFRSGFEESKRVSYPPLFFFILHPTSTSAQQISQVSGTLSRSKAEGLCASVPTQDQLHLVGSIHQHWTIRTIRGWDTTLLEKSEDRLVSPAHPLKHKDVRWASCTDAIIQSGCLM